MNRKLHILIFDAMKQLFHKPQSCERNKYDAELCIVPAFFNFPFSDLKESGYHRYFFLFLYSYCEKYDRIRPCR